MLSELHGASLSGSLGGNGNLGDDAGVRAVVRMLPTVMVAAAVASGLVVAPGHAAGVEPLPSASNVDYQLGGAYAPAKGVGIVVRDSTAPPVPGAYNVCYVNGFQTQPDARSFWRKRPGLVLRRHGNPVVDPGWPDEWLLNISTAAKRKRLATIVGRSITGCAAAGYQGVEFDNFDSFTRSRGMLKARHANAFARLLVRAAHRAGLAAGQKNRASYDGRRLGFDFVVAESCGRWNECADYVAHYGNQVLAIEYRRSDFRRACAQIGARVPVVLADRELSVGGPRAWC